MPRSEIHAAPAKLKALARLYGIEAEYTAADGRRQSASYEGIWKTLEILGLSLTHEREIGDALRAGQSALWQKAIEPVNLIEKDRPRIRLRLPADQSQAMVRTRIVLENGGIRQNSFVLGRADLLERKRVEGRTFETKMIRLGKALPYGYHRLELELGGRIFFSTLILAPQAAFVGKKQKSWGVFAPTYALHSCRSWGSGNLSDLAACLTRLSRRGGHVLATLPLLAAFLDAPFDPSPYNPVSRLFWNEFYLDVGKIPELKFSPTAQNLLASADFQVGLKSLRTKALICYKEEMALKRRVLEILAADLFSTPSLRRDALQRHLKQNPRLEDYARFRAVGERFGKPWQQWPEPQKNGGLGQGDFSLESFRYHVYVQWLMQKQMDAVAKKAKKQGSFLCLDYPVGVHNSGYDAWREQDLFLQKVAVGAPPDPFFSQGQNWGFAPLHPERMRETAHAYLQAGLRHHLRCAGMLRIDHVMALHRLFLIPHGLKAAQGVYLRYPTDELYAVFCLESQRHRSLLVGEDLGTVPQAVGPLMEKHAFHRMYITQYQLKPDLKQPLNPVPENAVAGLNTHDMPPFRAFWQGDDISHRLKTGLLDEAGAKTERQRRQTMKDALTLFLRKKKWLGKEADSNQVMHACLRHLALSPARFVILTLEDLWGETQPQNRPGTASDQSNWQRKFRYGLTEIFANREMQAIFREVNRLRKQI